MKKLKKQGLFILCLFVLFGLFTISASANETTDEIYKRQYESSGASKLDSLLDDDTNDILKDMGIDIENPNGNIIPKSEAIISLITDFLTDGIKNPLKTTLSIIGILLIFASFDGLGTELGGNSMSGLTCFTSCFVAVSPAFYLMDGVRSAVQTVSNFMLGLVPIYSGIMLSQGKTAAAGGFSTLLLGASEVISYLISYFFIPLSGAVLCLGVCGGISPIPMALRLSASIKKTSIWAMGIATTLFLGVLSLQNSFSAVSDGIVLRTSKVMLSTAIPIMGPAISETINTARGCAGLLKSGVGIYAVAAIIIMVLPIIIQIILWRVSMWITAGVAEIFGMKQVENMLRSVDFCLSVLLSATAFIALLFIISLTIGTGVS